MESFEGSGLVNGIINKLPFELHVPGYQYLGPGTKLHKRVKRGDLGINKLDQAAKEHDIAYSKSNNLNDRHISDKVLEEKAWQRVKSKDASVGEKTAAWFVTNVMKVKRKLGMGLENSENRKSKKGVLKKKPKKKQQQQKLKKGGVIKKKTIAFRQALLNPLKKHIRRHKSADFNDVKKLSHKSLLAARQFIRDAGGRRNIRIPRVLPLPKTGGFLPLIPIFAALSAVGGISGGVAAVAKTIVGARNAQKQLEESKRHNKEMESIAMGRGLYLRKHRSGLGLFRTTNTKN